VKHVAARLRTPAPIARAVRWSVAVTVLTVSAVGLLLVSAYVEGRRVWPTASVPHLQVTFRPSEQATSALRRARSLVSTVRAMEQAARADREDPEARTAAERSALGHAAAAWIAADGEAQVSHDAVDAHAARAIPSYFLSRAGGSTDARQAFEYVTTGLALAGRVQRAGPALALLVAGAELAAEAANAATERLSDPAVPLSDAALAGLAAVLAADLSHGAAAGPALAAECESLEGALAARRPSATALLRYDHDATVSLLHARCAAAVDALGTPAYVRRLPVFPSLSGSGLTALAIGLDNGAGRAALDRIAFDTLLRAASIADRAAAARARLAVQVALLRAFRRDGAYPERLDALVPDFLTAVPTDPITGRPPQWTAASRELSTKGVRGSVVFGGG
jgi:hypothetical protein